MSVAPTVHPGTAEDHAVWYRPRLARRRLLGRVFAVICGMLALSAVAVLGTLIAQIVGEGWSRLSPTLITNFPSELVPEAAGIRSALLGTLWLVLLTSLCSITIGVAAAIYLEEFAPHNRLIAFIQLNIANLAGVPSIVYGILGLAVFVRWLYLGESIIAGALTLSLLIMPIIIIASREALASVPDSIRQAAFALGATRWQTVWHHVLPSALPGVITGIILAMSRAIGETAPLLMVGATGYVAFVPGRTMLPPSIDTSLTWFGQVMHSHYTALPIQIYDWSQRPQPVFQELAAAAIMVLLGVLLTLNGVAAAIRIWQQRHRISG